MKTAIAANGKNLTSQVDERFGRASYFIITDEKAESIEEVIENLSKNEQTGAGIGAASLIAEKGVSALVAGNLGPKAEAVINTAGIQFISFAGTVSEALDVVKRQRMNTVSPDKPTNTTGGSKTIFPSGNGINQGQRPGMGQGRGSGMCQGRGLGMGRGKCQNPGMGRAGGGRGGKMGK